MQTYETKSTSSTKKWLIGCGIGCGVVIIILILVATGAFFFVKNIVQEFKDTETLMSTLTERYGRVREFCPDPDGLIRSDRLEAFLSIRNSFAPTRQKLEKSLGALSRGKDLSKVEIKTPRNVFKMIKLGVGVIPQMSEYFKSRNQALLAGEMGLGEYYFIYVISYYSWLGKSPEHGPDFQLVGRDEDFEDWDREEVHEIRRVRLLRRIHRIILPMLHNQLEKLTSSSMSSGIDEWREMLAVEVEAMEADRFRLPWQDGLPQAIQASLLPFRSRLEGSFSLMTNPLELVLEQK